MCTATSKFRTLSSGLPATYYTAQTWSSKPCSTTQCCLSLLLVNAAQSNLVSILIHLHSCFSPLHDTCTSLLSILKAPMCNANFKFWINNVASHVHCTTRTLSSAWSLQHTASHLASQGFQKVSIQHKRLHRDNSRHCQSHRLTLTLMHLHKLACSDTKRQSTFTTLPGKHSAQHLETALACTLTGAHAMQR